MPVMRIRKVWMGVRERVMSMSVRVARSRRDGLVVGVIVMIVRAMRVCVCMLQRLVQMLVHMVLGQMQPHARSHQTSRNPECKAGWLAKQGDGNRGANKGGRGEISPGARRTHSA